jgi:chromosome segregation ATPase
VTLDQWRARYEELDAEAARLRTERNAARAEAAKLQSLIDLQQTRMDAANTLWQDAHPEKEHLCPDLGDLLAWLIEERAVLKTFRQLDRAALADAQVEAARTTGER